jgi:hypothetical protein
MKTLFSILIGLIGFSTYASSKKQESKELSILFIGNSYTFYNDMPFILKKIALSTGKEIFVDTVVEGGKNLDYHCNQELTFKTINARKWDFVVIQGHSNEFAQPESKVNKTTYPFAKQLVDSIRANNECSQILLYLTWGYKHGNHKWKPIAHYDSMQSRIENQYLRFADLLNTRVSPVGIVWKDIRENHPYINLYDADDHHPSLNGSYLAACTFYTSIFGESAYKNTIEINIPIEERNSIELAAAKIVLNNLPKWRFTLRKDPEPAFDIILQDKDLTIINNAKNASSFEWDFGDGDKSFDKNPTHKYLETGSYTITQRLIGRCKNFTLSRKINIR